MFKNRPRILITNDDGIFAPGIKSLWSALRPHADVFVVAPSGEQSAVALSTTIRTPLHIESICWGSGDEIWTVSGTPTDCIKLALNVIMKQPPDIIVSGINKGTNSGRNVLYSGTVAAAIESVLQGIPAIAFSCRDFIDPDYTSVAKYVPIIVKHVIEHPLPEFTLLNVNFPEKSHGEIKGFKMTRQGKEYWAENPIQRIHPGDNSIYYWMGARLKSMEEEEDSDITWLQRGYLTAVPVHVGDLTDHAHLKKSKRAFEEYFLQPAIN